jgi:hypothetical protein
MCRNVLIELKLNDFNTVRRLSKYNTFFNRLLRPRLAKLTGKDIWIDMGAGHQYAQIDYLIERATVSNPEDVPQLMGFAYKHPEGQAGLDTVSELAAMYGNRISYNEGLQTPEKIRKMPQADVITDVMGFLTYSNNQKAILQAYVSILREGGTLFIYGYNLKMDAKKWLDLQIENKSLKVKKIENGTYLIEKINRNRETIT